MKADTLVVLLLVALPLLAFANGGDQRVIGDTYLVNLSRSPFTPRVGAPTKMLVSFVDLKSGFPIAEDLIVEVRIAKQGGQTLFEQSGLRAERGVLELSYTFTESDLHEIFFNFALASSPQKVYEAPDFLLDVQRADQAPQALPWPLVILITGALCAAAGYVFGKRAA